MLSAVLAWFAREFVSETSVKSHRGRVLAKRALRDRLLVVLVAHDRGLPLRR